MRKWFTYLEIITLLLINRETCQFVQFDEHFKSLHTRNSCYKYLQYFAMFSRKKIGMVADREEVYLYIAVSDEQSEMMRFFWALQICSWQRYGRKKFRLVFGIILSSLEGFFQKGTVNDWPGGEECEDTA